MEPATKCKHLTCSCSANPLLSEFCSPQCLRAHAAEESGEEPMSHCLCEHPDCNGIPTVSDEIQGMNIASEALCLA
jgi:hypothetical protein